MNNPLRGEASFKAGVSTFTLVFDVNAFCELEDETGFGVAELIEQIQDKPSFRLLRSIFCAGLQTHHPKTSLAEAGEIMSDAGLEGIKNALRSALQAAMPSKADSDQDESAEGKARRKRAGTGSSS
ncbi:hypothetical protein N6H05_09960 [Sphingobium sp. WTD-1]|uniref:hypothetical protein n=1 Tax=Sphingobium sp. WTD-1 TaxID=2979467 RepID=UPI0024DE20E0|nr:hypothetical protein [Sphingobium sp. WTD-1]WIA58092.1 hypothetical protein N6H05_09960 [Sphingobium sp. WTD-1]